MRLLTLIAAVLVSSTVFAKGDIFPRDLRFQGPEHTLVITRSGRVVFEGAIFTKSLEMDSTGSHAVGADRTTSSDVRPDANGKPSTYCMMWRRSADLTPLPSADTNELELTLIERHFYRASKSKGYLCRLGWIDSHYDEDLSARREFHYVISGDLKRATLLDTNTRQQLEILTSP